MTTDTVLRVVVSPFLRVLLENISSLIKDEIAGLLGVEKEIKKLSRTLSTIRDVLHDAEEKQPNDRAISNWLDELKDAAYDAEDVLDECAFDGLQFASETKNSSFRKQVIDSLNQVKLRRQIGNRIEKLTERFDEIAKRKKEFHLEATAGRKPEISHDRETSSTLDDPEVLGRDEDKDNLVRLLLNNVNNHQDVSICPIVGIGGIGKTTLAKLVYNDERVTKHFEPKGWVCVSEDFDVNRIIKKIISSMSRDACNLKELDPLKRKLEEKLHEKRFLLVLDDIWNEDQDKWDKLKGSLRCGAKGSSVIVTTRLQTVASITGTLPVYCLEVLSEDDCWSLFRKRAFGYMNEESPDLVEIGKSIVKKCGGVPLAAKALGGTLSFKNDHPNWLSVRDSEIWDLQQSNENNILPALRLSYNHLPSHLKQCFAYCSIFPRDWEIKKESLVHLWMANGLVQSKGGIEMEDVGNEIFNALLMRSFFQDAERDKDGNIEVCKMHDLMHNLACHIAMGECCIMDIEKVEKITRRTRHMSMDSSTRCSSSQQLESILKSSPCLRSLIKFDAKLSIENPQFILSSLKCLRALDLSKTSVTKLPNSIGKMKHLRYLDLSKSEIVSLPESIGKLRNLQTIYLTNSTKLKTWPKDMRKINSLRHLEIRGCNSLANMPVEMGQLTSLQTLYFFVVGSESRHSIKELRGLNQLRGPLGITKLENVQNSSDAKEALVEKKNLHTLWLSWSTGSLQQSTGILQHNAVEVIEGLQPHSNLRRLDINWYHGVRSPNWLKGSSSLPNLVEISLSNWERCDQLSLGKLPNLKVLRMYKMESLKFIDDGVYGEGGVKGFPSLEKLELHWMPNLERWSSAQSESQGELFPCLRELILTKCPKLIIDSLPSPLQEVRITECNERVLGSLQNLPCLSKLEIWSIYESEYFPEGMLRNLIALKELEIGNYVGLKRLPELSGMSNLESLTIDDSSELEIYADDLSHLVALQRLQLSCLPKLTCLPEGIKYAAATLQLLEIVGCYNLMELPEWMQHLTHLQDLKIYGCNPELKRRCEKDKGEDWYKISHIPNLVID